MKRILYLTDLYYEARGREYFREDLYLTGRLKDHFGVLIGHPQQALSFIKATDIIVFRNTGPVMAYHEYFDAFADTVRRENLVTFNSFDGKADMVGKQYLIDLTRQGLPVIPTIDNLEDLALLGNPESYIVKLKRGADSIGMQRVSRSALDALDLSGRIIQPYIDFKYEVSFYFLNNQFMYSLYAPNKERRWNLQEYEATPEDLAFARQFIAWDNMQRGIIRVDACRQQQGPLLLVELEDLNPYLSLDVLPEHKREAFVQAFISALQLL